MKRLAKFLFITFAVSWTAWWGLAVLTSCKILSFSHPLGTILHILGGFGPTIATFFVLEGKNTFQSVMKFIFGYRKKSLKYLFLFCIFEILIIGFSSGEWNPAISPSLIPLVFLQATFIYGGEEELGWRGIMQPILDQALNFPSSAIMTGIIWGMWHIPLWFIVGSSQQNMSFPFFLAFAVILSFWLATIYKKTGCVFACSVFHGLTNTLLSVFVIKLNVLLLVGMIALLVYSIDLWYRREA